MEPFDWKPSCAGPVCYVAGIALICLGLAFGAGYWQGQSSVTTQAMKSQDTANIAHGVADANQSQAIAADSAIEVQAPKLAEARANVARKVAALAIYRTATTPQPPTDPAPIDVAELAPMDRAKDDLIASQAILITEQDTKIHTLTLSRDAWKSTAAARDIENLNLRAANAAKDGLITGALWKGRIQGLAIGVASGYVAGRVH